MREFDATNDKKHFDAAGDTKLWPVFKGASFNIWNPDTGEYYASADPKKVIPILQEKRVRQQRLKSSPFSEFDPTWARDPKTLPCHHPRIAFRDVARATDSRTVIAALVPGNIVITNQAPYLLWPTGDEQDQAYLLGILCSIPLDWYARRFVETHVNFHIFNSLPVPRPGRDDPIRRVVEINAGRLAATDNRFADWAAAVGVSVGSVKESERDDLIAEIDAAVCILYALEDDEITHLIETFHVGWDYKPRLDAVLKHYANLRSNL